MVNSAILRTYTSMHRLCMAVNAALMDALSSHLDGVVAERAFAIEALQQDLTRGHDDLWAPEQDACFLHHLRPIHAQAGLLLCIDAMGAAGGLLQLLLYGWR